MLAGSRCFPLRPNSDIAEWGRHVRSVPSADLLNHLVGDSPDQARLLVFGSRLDPMAVTSIGFINEYVAHPTSKSRTIFAY
jgi:hypothetical protein